MSIQGLFTPRVLVSAAAMALIIAAPAFAGADTANVQHGSTIFHETCVACHGANGKGAIPGAPDFTKADGVLALPENLLEKRVEDGYHSAGSPMAMPAKGGNPNLSESDIKDVLAYLHKQFHPQTLGKR